MDAGLGLAPQSNRIGELPEAQLLMAIEIADNAIVWRPHRYKCVGIEIDRQRCDQAINRIHERLSTPFP